MATKKKGTLPPGLAAYMAGRKKTASAPKANPFAMMGTNTPPMAPSVAARPAPSNRAFPGAAPLFTAKKAVPKPKKKGK